MQTGNIGFTGLIALIYMVLIGLAVFAFIKKKIVIGIGFRIHQKEDRNRNRTLSSLCHGNHSTCDPLVYFTDVRYLLKRILRNEYGLSVLYVEAYSHGEVIKIVDAGPLGAYAALLVVVTDHLKEAHCLLRVSYTAA